MDETDDKGRHATYCSWPGLEKRFNAGVNGSINALLKLIRKILLQDGDDLTALESLEERLCSYAREAIRPDELSATFESALVLCNFYPPLRARERRLHIKLAYLTEVMHRFVNEEDAQKRDILAQLFQHLVQAEGYHHALMSNDLAVATISSALYRLLKSDCFELISPLLDSLSIEALLIFRREGRTLLQWAAKANSFTAVSQLLKKIISDQTIDSSAKKLFYNNLTNDYENAVYLAVENDNVAMVSLFAEEYSELFGPSIFHLHYVAKTTPDSSQFIPLHLCVELNANKTLEYLLSVEGYLKQSDYGEKAQNGNYALQSAIEAGKVESARLFLSCYKKGEALMMRNSVNGTILHALAAVSPSSVPLANALKLSLLVFHYIALLEEMEPGSKALVCGVRLSSGDNPFELAMKYGHGDMAGFIQDFTTNDLFSLEHLLERAPEPMALPVLFRSVPGAPVHENAVIVLDNAAAAMVRQQRNAV